MWPNSNVRLIQDSEFTTRLIQDSGFTVKLIQDSGLLDIWPQVLSSVAIIVAAGVAAWFANKKDRQKTKTKGRYLLSLLELLDSYIFVLSESLKNDDWIEAFKKYGSTIEESKKIIDTLEDKIFKFASSTTYDTLVELQFLFFYYKESEQKGFPSSSTEWIAKKNEFVSSWKITGESIHRARGYHKRYLCPCVIGMISLALFRAKLKREDDKKNREEGKKAIS